MTFTEIVTEIMDRLDLSSTTATTRVGRAVNRHYKRTTGALGIAPVTRRVTVTEAATIGSPSITFNAIEKVERVIDATSTPVFILDTGKSFDEMRQTEPSSSDSATEWAVEAMGATSVTLRFDVAFATAKVYTVDGYGKRATLSLADVPAFPESFHDILVERVMADELRKLENKALADRADAVAEHLTSALRLWIAVDAYKAVRQERS
jgi:hypothetical protein